MALTMLNTRFWSVSGATALTIAVACADLTQAGQAPAEDAAILRARAEKIWTARVQDQWDVVFDLMPAAEQQAAGDRDKFNAYNKEKGWFRYLDAKVGDAHIREDVGWVQVTYQTGLRQYPTMPPQETKIWEIWLKADDWRPLPRGLSDQYPSRPPALRPADEEAAVWKRQDALWRAREAQDWAAIYEFFDPAFRAATPKEDFLKRKSKYLYLRHKIDWVEVEGNSARTKAFFEQKLNDPTLHKLDPSTEVGFESWIKVGDEWYRYAKPDGAAATSRPGNEPKD